MAWAEGTEAVAEGMVEERAVRQVVAVDHEL
jgi:hypothetical protein